MSLITSSKPPRLRVLAAATVLGLSILAPASALETDGATSVSPSQGITSPGHQIQVRPGLIMASL